MKAKLKNKTDDDAQGGAASGTGVPTHAAQQSETPALSNDIARALVAIARNGGAVANVVLPDTVTTVTTIRLREAGLIETLPTLGAERTRVRLSAIGIQRLIEAQRIVAAIPGMSR